MATVSNNSRKYFLSNENVSEDIRESIEYSMNFQQGASGTNSSIAEMISGSHQVSQSRQSKYVPKTKPILTKPEVIVQENNYQVEEIQGSGGNNKKAVYLGDQIFEIIRERYMETNKITTDDPQVLYDFYLGQRKNMSSMKPITEKQIQKQMPSMQRKLLIKYKFQKMLTYYPNDVYYSLCFYQAKLQKDRKLSQNVEILNQETKKKDKKKVSKKQLDQIVQHLYKAKKKRGEKDDQKNKSIEKVNTNTVQENQKQKRNKFGRNLSEHFQNTYREKGSPYNIETVERLFTFWSDLYEREQYGIQWDEDTAQQAIQQYMYEQIQDLMNFAAKKVGFKHGKANSLFKFYRQNQEKLSKFIFIPFNSFQQYGKVFNKVQLIKQQQEEKQYQKAQQSQIKKQKLNETKQFGRPVSATPLTILAQPRNHSTSKQISQLHSKYPHNKVVQQMYAEQNLKKPRYAFEYGVYDLKQQVKTKQWIKIDPKGKVGGGGHEGRINRELLSTYGEGGWLKDEQNDRLMNLFAQQNLAENEHWKNLGPIMHETMLVKAYENRWFVDCIIRYLERVLGEKQLKLETNNVIFKKLFHYLTDELDQNSRQSELSKLQTIILTSESIADKTKQINTMANNADKNSNNFKKQRRLVNAMLEQKAIQWVRMRVKKKDQNIMLRTYLKQLYEDISKQHKQYVKKQFNAVDGCNEVPKLLKYQFFRLIKQINPITLEFEAVPRSYAWIPTKGNKNAQQNLTYKTFNQISEQKQSKPAGNIYQAQPQPHKNELWANKKGKQRQLIMMSYQDAQQCTFHPKISKKYM